MKPIIVGIDPGMTAAYAAIDFDYSFLKVESKRDFSLSEMISSIMSLGDPIICGTDKKEFPNFIKKFSQRTGAKLFTPNYDTKKEEKRRIVRDKGFLGSCKNDHEIDALASAIYAINSNLVLIQKMKRNLEKRAKDDIFDRIVPLVFLEEMSIDRAISLFEDEGEEIVNKVKRKRRHLLISKRELTKEEKEIFLLRQQNEKLEDDYELLMHRYESLKNRRIDIDLHVRRLLSHKEQRILFFDKVVKRQKKEIKSLKKHIGELKRFLSSSNGSIVLKKMGNLGKKEYELKKDVLKITKGDVLLIDDLGIISKKVLFDLMKDIKILVYRKLGNRDLLKDFILVDRSILVIEEERDFGITEKDAFDRAVKRSKDEKKFDYGMIEEIIKDYRNERIRSSRSRHR